MRTAVWFVRHGQTHANRAQRYQSWSDTPLTSYGQRQVALLAQRLQRIPFNVVLLSPVGRTRATADALLIDRPGVLRAEMAAWDDLHQGNWEGLTYREVQTRFPKEAQQRFAAGLHGRAAGGESLHEAASRVQAAWDNLQQQYAEGRVLVVTHALPIQLVLCAVAALPPDRFWQWRCDLGSLTSLDVYKSATIVRMVNEVPRAGLSAD